MDINKDEENARQYMYYYLSSDGNKYPIFVRISEQEMWLFKTKAKRKQLIQYYKECKNKRPDISISSLIHLELMFKQRLLFD